MVFLRGGAADAHRAIWIGLEAMQHLRRGDRLHAEHRRPLLGPRALERLHAERTLPPVLARRVEATVRVVEPRLEHGLGGGWTVAHLVERTRVAQLERGVAL